MTRAPKDWRQMKWLYYPIINFLYLENIMDWKINKYNALVNALIAASSQQEHKVPFVNDSVDWIWQSTRSIYELSMIINE